MMYASTNENDVWVHDLSLFSCDAPISTSIFSFSASSSASSFMALLTLLVFHIEPMGVLGNNTGSREGCNVVDPVPNIFGNHIAVILASHANNHGGAKGAGRMETASRQGNEATVCHNERQSNGKGVVKTRLQCHACPARSEQSPRRRRRKIP